jgi:putative protease
MAARRKGTRTARRKPVSRARAAKPKASARRRKKPAQPKAKPKRSQRPIPARGPAAGERRLVAGAALEVGVVLHYYPRAAAAVVSLSRPIHRGDRIHVRGHTTDFVQSVTALALDGSAVAEATPPQQVGVQLEQRARVGDRVFRVSW